MALRQIRIKGDPILRKKSKEVKEINDNIKTLIGDMKETMEDANGVGLAAPQVGKLRRVVIVVLGDETVAMVNPEIVEREGESVDVEGCLSIPGFRASVLRPNKIKVVYLNEDGEKITRVEEGFRAREILHEVDHLDGILFSDKYIDEYVLDENGELVKYE